MPDLESNIWRKYQNRGVLVYGLHSGESAKQLADFVQQTGITFKVFEDRGSLNELAFPPGVGYPYPRDVVIGKDLTVRHIASSFSVQELQTLIERLLKE